LFDFKNWRPRFAEKQVKTIFWGVAPQKKKFGKNPLHPQEFACSYTCVKRSTVGQQRLGTLALLRIESNLLKKLT